MRLAARGLKPVLVTLVQPGEKFSAALQVRRRQVFVILSEPGQQVVVFYFSFHIILSGSYILQDAGSVKLEACCLKLDA